MSMSSGTLNFRSAGVLISGCLFLFLSSGSFKGSGVLFEDAVRLYATTNVFGGWAFSFQMSIGFLLAGVGGAVLNGFSNRVTGVIGGFLFGLGFSCIGIFGQSFWSFVVFLAIVAFGIGLMYFACFMSFVEHFKGDFAFYNSIRHMFGFVGITLMPPLIEVLRINFGFRGSYLILGAICWNAVICGILFKGTDKKTKDERNVEEERKLKKEEDEDRFNKCPKKSALIYFLDISPIRRHPNFVFFLITHALVYYNLVVWAIFLVPFGTSLGFKPEVAVFLSTAGGIGGFIGKIAVVVTFYQDQMNALTSSLVPAFICNVGLLGYLCSDNEFPLLVCSSLCGFSFAFTESALSGLIPRYICGYHLRQGLAISYVLSGIFMQFGGILSGAVLDFTSSYSLTFGVTIAVNVIMSISAVALHITYKPVTDCKA